MAFWRCYSHAHMHQIMYTFKEYDCEVLLASSTLWTHSTQVMAVTSIKLFRRSTAETGRRRSGAPVDVFGALQRDASPPQWSAGCASAHDAVRCAVEDPVSGGCSLWKVESRSRLGTARFHYIKAGKWRGPRKW